MEDRVEDRVTEGRSQEEEKEDKVQGCLTLALYIWSLVLIFVVAVTGMALTIPKLVIGGLYFDDCPLQPLLPVFLLVDACVGIVHGQCCKKRQEGGDDTGLCEWSAARVIRTVVGLFQIIWLVFGTVWVIEVREAQAAPGYCQPVTRLSTPQPIIGLPGNLTDMNHTTYRPITEQDQAEGGSIILSTLGTDQSDAASPDQGAEPSCQKCHHVLVEFSLVTVIMHWIVVACVALVYLLMLMLQINFSWKNRGLKNRPM